MSDLQIANLESLNKRLRHPKIPEFITKVHSELETVAPPQDLLLSVARTANYHVLKAHPELHFVTRWQSRRSGFLEVGSILQILPSEFPSHIYNQLQRECSLVVPISSWDIPLHFWFQERLQGRRHVLEDLGSKSFPFLSHFIELTATIDRSHVFTLFYDSLSDDPLSPYASLPPDLIENAISEPDKYLDLAEDNPNMQKAIVEAVQGFSEFLQFTIEYKSLLSRLNSGSPLFNAVHSAHRRFFSPTTPFAQSLLDLINAALRSASQAEVAVLRQAQATYQRLLEVEELMGECPVELPRLAPIWPIIEIKPNESMEAALENRFAMRSE